ncbi:MAG: hypothetical protein SFV52_09385 [Saprospiraceae bacterium]|nr:hypothetical protein [Saprospiraceae bacterium]
MSHIRNCLLPIAALCLMVSCKKEGVFPEDIRPADFYAQFTIEDATGRDTLFSLRGEDSVPFIPGYSLTIEYLSDAFVRDSIRYIWGGLGVSLFPRPFFIQLSNPQPQTDPFVPVEWQAEELEQLLYPGKTWQLGNAPGEAVIGIADFPDGLWSFSSAGADNTQGYLRVLEVSDYGVPDLGTPYFGKKVRFQFTCSVINADGETWTLRDGEAVMFFRYYTF